MCTTLVSGVLRRTAVLPDSASVYQRGEQRCKRQLTHLQFSQWEDGDTFTKTRDVCRRGQSMVPKEMGILNISFSSTTNYVLFKFSYLALKIGVKIPFTQIFEFLMHARLCASCQGCRVPHGMYDLVDGQADKNQIIVQNFNMGKYCREPASGDLIKSRKSTRLP